MILVEVKLITNPDFLGLRMSRQQKQRLERAYLRLQTSSKVDIEFHYVVVSQQGKLEVFDDFLG